MLEHLWYKNGIISSLELLSYRAKSLSSIPQADVAQLVEHLIRNEGVTGSNPVVGSILGG